MTSRDWTPEERARYDGICTACLELTAEPGFKLCGPCSNEERADIRYHERVEEGRP